jgi:hypothetical protein
MIIDIIKGDIFKDAPTDIVFAINMEGANDAGFAGLVAERYWPKLATLVPAGYGQVASHVKDGITFWAICCHSLDPGGWDFAPGFIEAGLNILFGGNPKHTYSVVLMGAGMIGQMQGANVFANLGAIARAKPACKIYTL